MNRAGRSTTSRSVSPGRAPGRSRRRGLPQPGGRPDHADAAGAPTAGAGATRHRSPSGSTRWATPPGSTQRFFGAANPTPPVAAGCAPCGRPAAPTGAVRGQGEGTPDPGDGRLGHACRRGHRAGGPVCGVRRFLLQCPDDDAFHVGIGDLPRDTWPGLVGQAVQTAVEEAPSPSADRVRSNLQPP